MVDWRLGRSLVHDEPWLRPAAADAAMDLYVRQAERLQPVKEILYRRWVRTRYYQACHQTIQRVCGLCGAQAVTPFMEPSVVAAIGAEAGIGGFWSRSQAMTRLFGDLLPAELLRRRTKAVFTRSLNGNATRSFVAGWDGSGVDTNLVDPGVLRTVWSAEEPDFRSHMLLQQAALTTGWVPEG